MAQLKDSLITGDLRVTGTIYGLTTNSNQVLDYNDNKPTKFGYSTSGMTTASWIGAWDNSVSGEYRLRAISPANLKTVMALNNVENTKLSTWTGSTAITTLGTISTGTIPWANVSNKPSQATSWPNWGQILQSGANNIEEGTSNFTDNTEIFSSYASDNGFADTNAPGKVYRRDAIKLYNYIKSKTDALYATSGHNHDSTYLKLSGGTMTGGITFPSDSTAYTTKGIVYAAGSKIGENTSGGLGIYATERIYLRPGSSTSSSGDGVEISTSGLYPTNNNSETLGDSSHKWSNVYATTFTGALSGNATSATGFASAKTIALTGNVTGSATGGNGSNGWSIATTIGSGVVTNAMLAGSIANGKLVNSKVTIAGNDVSLGGTLAAATLKTSLGLNSAMHYIGKATVAITDGSTTDPKIGGNATTLATGDVVIDSSDSREYVWNGSAWELLGGDSSYKVTQTAVTDTAYSGSDTATTFVSAVTQNANGEITVTKRKLPTYNNYSHPTGDGNKHVPANGTSNNGKFLQATGTAGTYQWASLPTASTTAAGIIQIGTDASNAAAGNHNHDSVYVNVSGDTMTGILKAYANQYTDDYTTCGINMQNSDIVGLNSIYTMDSADGAGEGIHFYRDSTHVDTLWINGGDILFVPNRALGTNTTKANSQKVGRFTANPTTGQVVITDGTTGGIKSSGYTIATSVPSGAKFTDTNYYHTTGSWSGLTYTATANGGAGALAFTIPTGTSATTVAVGNHTHDKSTITSVYEANLEWGGKNFSASYGPIDAAMIQPLGANRFAFLKPAGLTIEYSTDGGSTWTDYGATNIQKTGLFGKGQGFILGKHTTAGTNTVNDQLRVTISTSEASLYTALNKIAIYMSTNGNTVQVKMEKALQSTPTSFSTHLDWTGISGWSGWNILNINSVTTYGNTAGSQYGKIRFTFKQTAVNTNYSSASISRIMGFGGQGWTVPSNMAADGHLYSYDNDQNAVFPAKVTATTLAGNLDWSYIQNKPTLGTLAAKSTISDHSVTTPTGATSRTQDVTLNTTTVNSITAVGTLPSLTVTATDVVTGGTTTDIPNITKKTVVTGVTKKTVVTGGSTTDVPNITKKTVVTSATAAKATYANGILTISDGSVTTGDSVTVGTAIKAYTSLTTGDSVTVTTGDSVTVGTAIKAYTALTTSSIGSASGWSAGTLPTKGSNTTVATGVNKQPTFSVTTQTTTLSHTIS